MNSSGTASPLSLLAEVAGDRAAVRGLDPAYYAVAHAAYESASDQRRRVRAWMTTEVPPLCADIVDRPVAVLGVGVGDGSVDASVAASLAAGGRRVAYDGIEPHAPSLAAFVGRLQALGQPSLRVHGSTTDLDAYPGSGPFDVVHFVHSLYYVPDIGWAIDRALELLRPGGALIALTSPREPLSILASLLAPQTGHPQWFAEAVADALATRGLDATATTIHGRLDLASLRHDPDGMGEHVLDFLIQARSADLRPAVRRQVEAHLADLTLAGDPDRVPHPLDAVVAIAP